MKSNAQRQRAYRERHLKDADGKGERLNTVINLSAKRSLEWLASCYGVTQRALLERIIAQAESDLLTTLVEACEEKHHGPMPTEALDRARIFPVIDRVTGLSLRRWSLSPALSPVRAAEAS